MNSLSMESIFLALSGVILMAGVLYWFWSHIQLTQKKVQLLENAIFELRGMVQRGGDGHTSDLGPGPGLGPSPSPGSGSELGPGPGPGPAQGDASELIPEASATATASLYNDLSDDDWKEEPATIPAHTSTPLEVPLDLQPGGRIEGVEVIPEAEEKKEELATAAASAQFRELFTSPPSASATATASAPASISLSDVTSLDGMAVKDLRRLAEQRGIPNVSELRKKEILSALKSQIGVPSSSSGVQVEKMLDLTEVSEILE